MIRLVVFLIVATALALGAVWLANHPGNVVIQWQGRELQTSVGILLLAFAAVAVVAALLFEVLRWLRWLPARMRRSSQQRREVRGYRELTSGLLAAAAGDVTAATLHQRQAEKLLPQDGATLLLAAQNAQLDNKEDVAHLKFRQMLRTPDTEFLGLRGLLAQAMRANDREEALNLVRRAYRRNPTVPWVLATLFELLARAEKWDEALSLVGEMKSRHVLTAPEAQRRRGILQHMLASQLAAADRSADALRHARQAVRLVPGFAPAAVLAAELSMRQGQRRRALRRLEEAWRAFPHPDLASAFAQLDEKLTPAERLRRFETRFAALHPDRPETHTAMAELAMLAEDWHTARHHLEHALAAEPRARVYRLLAELERHTGDPARAQEWLAQAIDARPDHAWVCDDTGEVVPAWRPFAPSGRFDAISWNVPPKVAQLIPSGHGPVLVGQAEAAPMATPETVPSSQMEEPARFKAAPAEAA